MKISDLSLDELKELVNGVVDDRLRELLVSRELGPSSSPLEAEKHSMVAQISANPCGQ